MFFAYNSNFFSFFSDLPQRWGPVFHFFVSPERVFLEMVSHSRVYTQPFFTRWHLCLSSVWREIHGWRKGNLHTPFVHSFDDDDDDDNDNNNNNSTFFPLTTYFTVHLDYLLTQTRRHPPSSGICLTDFSPPDSVVNFPFPQ